MTSLSQIGLIVVIACAIGIFGLAQWVSRAKAGRAKDTNEVDPGCCGRPAATYCVQE